MLLKWHYFIFYDWVIFHYIFYDMWTLDSGLTDVRDSPVSMNVLSWWGLNNNSSEETYVMVWASWKNSSSDMEPSLIILTATSYCPFHLPRWTTPNWPLPSSFNRIISSLCSSQIPSKARQAHFQMRLGGFGAKNFTSEFLSNENLTLTKWKTARLF